MVRQNTKVLFILLLFFAFIINIHDSFAQKQKAPVIQFSGVVIGPDSTSGVQGVHVYVPKAGRGTTSNSYGYFSMPVLIGDSVVISAVGYKRQHLIIPGNQGDSFTAIIELREDTVFLPEVEILPYPTEELFKEAILAMKLPDEYRHMNTTLNDEALTRMFKDISMSGNMNHRMYMDQQFYHMNDKFGPPSNPLLNPIAWSKFIQSIKRGDLKRKK